MNYNQTSLRGIMNRVKDLKDTGKNPYKRILMEKEKQNLSYEDLAEKLSGVEPDTLRKMLKTGQRIDEDIVQELYRVLGIQGELDNNEAVAVHHYIKNRPSDSGRPSKDDLDKRQKLYDEAHQRKSNPDKGEYSIDALLLDWSDMDDAEIESLTDDPEIENSTDDGTYDEIGLLKRVLILNRQFPELFEELISNFEFEKAELEEMEHMEISIEIHE